MVLNMVRCLPPHRAHEHTHAQPARRSRAGRGIGACIVATGCPFDIQIYVESPGVPCFGGGSESSRSHCQQLRKLRKLRRCVRTYLRLLGHEQRKLPSSPSLPTLVVRKSPRPSLMDMKNCAKTREMIAMSFMRMLSAGPDVSLSGSPTVSPVTAALCTSLPLPMGFPSSSSTPLASTNFLALSHAPPVFEAESASCTPEDMPPARRPQTAETPKKRPVRIGDEMTRRPGRIISLSDALVEMEMHFCESGRMCAVFGSKLASFMGCANLGLVGSAIQRSSGVALNWRATSSTISMAARPTDFMVMAENQYGSMAPKMRKQNVIGSRSCTLPLRLPARVTKPPKRARDTRAA